MNLSAMKDKKITKVKDFYCRKRPDELGAFSIYKEFLKSELPNLACGVFRIPPTEMSPRFANWPLTVIKPNFGSGGHHRVLCQGIPVTKAPDDWVGQPYLRGTHIRISVDESGFCAISVLKNQNYGLSIWQRVQPCNGWDWYVRSAAELRRRIGLAQAGLDIILSDTGVWLHDVNPAPDFSIHGILNLI